MTTKMDREELIKKFFELEDADERVVRAWDLFIDVQQAYRGEKGGTISRRELDKVRRKFAGHLKKNKLRMLDEEEGLKAHELAIVKEGEGEGEIKALNSFDVWLLVDFGEVCSALMADKPEEVEGFPDVIIGFLENQGVDEWLKERLIEKNKEAGERLLKTILEDRPAEVSVHSLLVEHYERESRFSEAEAEYQRMLSETDDELVWANYGNFLEKRGRYQDAFDAFKNSLEICERVGEEEAGEFLEEVKRDISRVERMKDLEGEKARVAREYQEAMWLIGNIKTFAEKRMEREIKKAQEEYMEGKDMEEIEWEDTFDFIQWFLFHRELSNGKVPGMVYAEEESLDEVTKEKLRGLGSPVEGTFEIVDVDHASFTLVVKDIITDEEYNNLMGNFPKIRQGQTFSGCIYPWSNFYLTGGAVVAHEEEYGEKVKTLVEELKSGKLLEDAKKELKKEHDAFVLYFGSQNQIFKSKKECEKVFNKFSRWFLFEYVSATEEEGKTAAEIYEEKYGKKPTPERTKLPRSFAGAGDIGAISYPEYGICFVRHYGFLKRVFDTGADDKIEGGKERLKETLLSEEPFILKKLMKDKEKNAVKIINRVFDAGLDADASEEEIGAFMSELREDWNAEAVK